MNLPRLPLIIITGLSGAGKTTALKVFEDMGFFTVDGLPLPMTFRLTELFNQENPRNYRGLALGVDIRQKDYLNEWEATKNKLISQNISTQVIFLEANEEILIKRYATTRRPHPLASQDLGLEQAIKEEKRLLASLKNEADIIIDTSFFSIHDLRRAIQSKFSYLIDKKTGLRIHLISFGYKYGIPKEADIVLDLRFLPNPYFEEDLKPLSGKEEAIQNYILKSEQGRAFLKKLLDFLEFILPLYAEEGRFRVTIAFGCTGGYHRSVAISELVFKELKRKNYTLSLEHRHFSLVNV
jgi:UPF0042 nucleotide-binding protein